MVSIVLTTLKSGLVHLVLFACLATRLAATEVDPPAPRPLRLSVLPPTLQGWPRVGGDYFNPTSPLPFFTLESSTNLRSWEPAAVLLQTPFEFIHPKPLLSPGRFYRIVAAPRTGTNDWSNHLELSGDPLFNAGGCGSDPLRWAKFAIELADPSRVYFQDSARYLLHVEFATNRLGSFRGLTPEQFNAIALHRANQQVVLGTVVTPFNGLPSTASEFAIQFSGLDPYPPEQVVQWFEIVRSAIASGEARALYLPAFEQAGSAEENRAYFAARGIDVISPSHWTGDTAACYATGWAVGRLVFVPATEIDAAYADGRLRPTDILLTDGVPAEVPYVSGLISLAPATPNSHVAILAQSYAVPFVYVADAAEQQRLRSLAGRTVALRTGITLTDRQILVLDVNGLNADLTNYIAQLKVPAKIEFSPKATFGTINSAVEGLTPADARFFGGKASNFGLLRRVIPDYSPAAVAFSFDLWDAYLAQSIPGGGTLRDAIQARLSEFTYPPDVGRLREKLGEVRSLIRNVGVFTPAQQNEIIAALSPFDRLRNIRFRSSTNVEDAERFSGAGLYDSFSGCLDDDLDGDTAGPSTCDPTEPEERGVFRAIRRVFASFYNENAFLERLRFGIDEDQVGMALLVHHSTPDAFELANGVATLSVQQFGGSAFVSGQLVTQAGAVSVANPDGTARPEVTDFYWSSTLTNVEPRESSSLVPLGTRVLSANDYPTLVGLLGRVAREYARPLTNRSRIQLDLEYKKETPGRLSIKQVREVPSVGGTNSTPTFLLTAPPEDYYPWGDIMGVHRLKSIWSLSARSTLLNAAVVGSNLYASARVVLLDGSTERLLEGHPGLWPQATHKFFATNNSWLQEDRFVLGAGNSRRDFTLETRFPQAASPTECPWRSLADAQIQCLVRYASPVPGIDFGGNPMLVTAETISISRPATRPLHRASVLIDTNRSVRLTSTQSLIQLVGQASDVPPDPRCFVIGPKSVYGFLGVDGQTTITGLLPTPIVLSNRYAQTYRLRGRQGHEDVEEILCEPALDPNVTPTQRAALASANVRMVYSYRYRFGDETRRMFILGFDNVFRAVP